MKLNQYNYTMGRHVLARYVYKSVYLLKFVIRKKRGKTLLPHRDGDELT